MMSPTYLVFTQKLLAPRNIARQNGAVTVGRTRARPLAPFGERLRQAIASSTAYKNRSDFAAALRLQPAVLYRYETGEQSPRLEDVERWAKMLDVAPAWLAYGTVDDAATPTEQDDDVRWAAEQVQLDEASLRHLRQVRSLLGTMSRAELLTAAEKPLAAVRR